MGSVWHGVAVLTMTWSYVRIAVIVYSLDSNYVYSMSGSGLYLGGLTWSIVLRCDDHTGIFTCDGCTRDRTFMCPPRHRAM